MGEKLLFDDWGSVVHLVLGLLLKPLYILFYPLPLIVIISFVVYELREVESEYKKLGDFIEFMVGGFISIFI